LLMTERARRETDATLAEAMGGAQGIARAAAGSQAGAARVKKALPKRCIEVSFYQRLAAANTCRNIWHIELPH
jgi:hypothetical protein